MNINDVYPSKYLKASDLQGKEITVTMDRVEEESVGQDGDTKPVLYFQGKQKGIVLNKTNSNNIMGAYGAETDNWSGKQIVLYSTYVDFAGKSVEAIRCRAARAVQTTKGGKQSLKHPETTHATDAHLNDEGPFT